MGMGEDCAEVRGCLRLAGHPGACEVDPMRVAYLAPSLIEDWGKPAPPQVTAPHTVAPESHAAAAVDPATLDPGIRRLVMHLRALGIPTTDSGDGVNKPADTRALDQPHVFAVYPRLDWRQALADADRVGALLPAREGSEISLAYNPHDQQLVLAIVGYGDGDLP
jgi:hypothetical protein